jgi:hypothetical protein
MIAPVDMEHVTDAQRDRHRFVILAVKPWRIVA